MARRAIELELVGRPIGKGLRDPKSVDAQCVKTIERVVGKLAARNGSESRSVGVGKPRNLDEEEIIEVAPALNGLPVIDLAARIGRYLSEVGLGKRGVIGVERNQYRREVR